MKANAAEKDSVINLFSFVKEVYDIKRPFNGNIDNRYISWKEIDPKLPGVSCWNPTSQDSNLLCVVERLPTPKAPQPASELSEWCHIDTDGNVVFKDQIERHHLDQDGHDVVVVENFTDQPSRSKLKATYQTKLAHWIEEKNIIKNNNNLFDKLMIYRDVVNSSNLKEELVLGNFIFDSSDHKERDNIKYPILTSPVVIDILEGTRLQLSIRLKQDEKTKIHNEIFVAFDKSNLNGQEFDILKELMQERNCNLIDADSYQEVISKKAVRLSPKCRWRASVQEKQHEDGVDFQIYPMPIFFVQTKDTGLKDAIGGIINKIQSTNDIPKHLIEIASPSAVPSVASEDEKEPSFEIKLARTAGEDPDILLTKTANAEQLAIAADIERNDVLLVQGPPGTGKTHTIANLMGHFLAQGKRILVTSDKVKALSVLKEKLPEEIQPLCVSRLGDQKDLLNTAGTLQEQLSRLTTSNLKKAILQEEKNRQTLIDELSTIRKNIYSIRQKDCQTITYNGTAYSFIDLAKLIHDEESKYADVIPGNVVEGKPCPNIEDLKYIYSTNKKWSEEIEAELSAPIPASQTLPSPADCEDMFSAFTEICGKYAENEKYLIESAKTDLSKNKIIVFKYKQNVCLRIPYNFRDQLSEIDRSHFNVLHHQDPVIQRMLVLGADDPAVKKKVLEAVALLEKIQDERKQLRVAEHDYHLKSTTNTALVNQAIDWFIDNQPEGKISTMERFLSKLVKRQSIEMEEIIKNALVNSEIPHSREDFETLRTTNLLMENTKKVSQIWERFIRDDSVPCFNSSDELIDALFQNLQDIKTAIAWWAEVFEPLRQRLVRSLAVSDYLFDPERLSPSERINSAKELASILSRILIHIEFKKETEKFDKWRSSALKTLKASINHSKIAKNLYDTLAKDGSEYSETFDKLRKIEEEREKYLHRFHLLESLHNIAPDWAEALRDHREGFNSTHLPLDIHKAWEWKQLEIIYRNLASLTIDGLQQQASRVALYLRNCTAKLAADKAWLAVKNRLESTGRAQLSALTRMATLMAKATGTGKNVERNRLAAMDLLPECNQAVPAWIMTLDQAIASFGNAGEFDIIIVDEASQADITALPILFMSKKIVVVGDDKQVTPDNVGTKIEKINSLSAQYLNNHVKSPALFDMKMSLYGIIKANAFRSRMLIEHFRCVPDIIGFCNQLCYGGKIRPLRDKNDTQLIPSIIPWRVDIKNYDFEDFNQDEADAAIDLINAMIKQPEYKGKTFGIISMRSAKGEIDRLRVLVNDRIDPKEKKDRDIICGTSAEFQGDERDVILMLLCDAPVPGVVARLIKPEANEDAALKRYNVAVSRAKDQLWVLHSFDPATQLRHGDIRAHLFAWIKGIGSQEQNEQNIRNQADSEFEVEVAKELVHRGYEIEQQHAVGNFRIDIVVHGQNDTVALECDGDRFHSGDEAIQNDMERQAILERNGWRFIRIRGGEYFRHPQKTMDRVCQALTEKGILPNLQSNEKNNFELLERIKAALSGRNVSTNELPNESSPMVSDAKPNESLVEHSDQQLPRQVNTAPSSVETNEEVIALPTTPSSEMTPPDSENAATESKIDNCPENTATDMTTAIELAACTVAEEKEAIAHNRPAELVEEPTSSQTTKPKRARTRTSVKKTANASEPATKTKKTTTRKKVEPGELHSSPLPTTAYSKRPNLTEDDKERILAADAVVWAELEALDCLLIDKRGNKGALWIVPPPGKKTTIEKTMFSLARRFKLSFVWAEKGGKATNHQPSWFIRPSNR